MVSAVIKEFNAIIGDTMTRARDVADYDNTATEDEDRNTDLMLMGA
jgi:hypothetical protein